MPRILDNIELDLGDALRTSLDGASSLDASVGYFNLRGWAELCEAVDCLPDGSQPIRLLVGMANRPDEDLRRRLRGTADRIDNPTALREIRYPSRSAAQAGLAIALSRLALFWWASTGDDFDVTKAGLAGTPTPPMSEKLIGQLSRIGQELAAEMGEHPIYTECVGMWMGNYDIMAMRSLTDQPDRLLLEELGMGRFWGDLKLAYDWFLKATGERPGSLRESPFKAARG